MLKKEILQDNSDVTSNSKELEILKKHFPQCFDKEGNFISHKMEEIVGESGLKLSSESYSLNWLGKSYARLLANEAPHTLIKEDKSHNTKAQNKKSQNLLIKGDNLEVLKHLSNAYSESIKMIYIDPPYNTGSDGFVYNDDRKFTSEELSRLAGVDIEEARRILAFTQSKANSHSAWLTFMYPRLYVARELLKEDGVIFISIDDNEQAQLKLLCDEVFGEENFVANIVRNTNSSKNQSLFVSVSHEYCLIYTKNMETLKLKHTNKKWAVPKNNVDEYVKKVKQLQKEGLSNEEITEELKTLTKYPRFIDFTNYWYFDDRGLYRKDNLGGVKDGNMEPLFNPITKKIDPVPPGGYRYNKEKLTKLSNENRIHFHADGSLPTIKRYLHENMNQRPKSIMSDDQRPDYTLLQEFNIPFDNPKQLSFMQRILSIEDKDDIILDFFAGSGTTAHAVMQLNAEDGGERKFITVQIAEPTDEKSEAYKAGYKTIFEITKARIEKASQKIKEENPDFKGDLGFKIYETTPLWDGYLDDIATLEDETRLFDGSSLNDEELETLLTTYKLHDGIALSEALQEVKLDEYKAYLAKETLYCVHSGFSTQALKTLIEKLDSDATFEPSRIILFGYNFSTKHQRELDEALSSYANKKLIELDLIVRY